MGGEVVILGVVHPLGAGGGMARGETEWTLRFWLQPWRVADGSLDQRRLAVEKPVSKDDLRAHMDRIAAYDVVRLRGRFDPAGDLIFHLAELVGPDDDAELARIAREQQTPVTREDATFGTLTLDRRFNQHNAEARWRGAPVRLTLEADDDALPAALEAARRLWADPDGWDRRVRDRAVADLLEIKNDNWRDEDDEGNEEDELTPEQFRARMTLESVSIDPDGEFTFWFDDGDLFFGHVIMVHGTVADGPTSAEFAG